MYTVNIIVEAGRKNDGMSIKGFSMSVYKQ